MSLVETVEQLRKETGKWTDGSRGLLVNAVDRTLERTRDDRPYRLGEIARFRRDGGWDSAARHVLDDRRRRKGWYVD